MFVYAANSFTSGYVVDKIYTAEDLGILVDAMYSLPGDGFIVYNSEFTSSFENGVVKTYESKDDPTTAEYSYVPIKGNDIEAIAKDKIVIRKLGLYISVSDKLPEKYTGMITKPYNREKKDVETIFFVYDDETKDFIDPMEFVSEKAESTAFPKKQDDSLYLLFELDKDNPHSLKIYYSSRKDEELIASNLGFARTINYELSENDIFKAEIPLIALDDNTYLNEFENAIILEIGSSYLSDAEKDIRQSISQSIEDYYDV